MKDIFIKSNGLAGDIINVSIGGLAIGTIVGGGILMMEVLTLVFIK